MKKVIMVIAIILAATTVTFAQMKMDSTHQHMKMAHKKYTCTMHPEVVRSRPGKCPKCGMKMVAKKMKGKKMAKPMGEMNM